MDTTIYSILIWITAILIVSLDLVIILGSQNRSSRVFVLLSFTTAIWVASQGFLVSTHTPYLADWLIRSQYVMGITIAMGFYIFSIIYPHETKPPSYTYILMLFVTILFGYLYLFSDYLNTGVIEIGGKGRWSWTFGPLHPLFDIIFSLIWIISLKKLYTSYILSTGILRLNLKNMFLALTLGIIPPTLANIILPTLGIYHWNWLGPISSAVWIFIIGYSIIRYRQMNVRVVITEVLAIAMTMIFFINIFTETPVGVWDNIATFLVFLILAIYLIRGVLAESRQKEELRDLNENLESKVAEQTVEIRKAFELEKKARRDLEKLNETKDQFIMITQHHLRTPVNNIQAKIQSIVTSADGPTVNEIKSELRETDSHLERLVRTVNDFLNITTIKPGGNILNLSRTNPKLLIADILSELKIDIEQKNLTVTYPMNDESWPTINVDSSKIRDALLIIIENAVKYNNMGGMITIKTIFSDKILNITVADTGIGISKHDQGKIFSNLFTRSNEAKKMNPIGMGIGLSVAKAIIKAHHGDLAIRSNDQERGTTVIVSIPRDYLSQI
jgi:signal transduction histidine kinase